MRVCARECGGWDQALAWGRNGGESSTSNVYVMFETKGCLARTGRERDTHTDPLTPPPAPRKRHANTYSYSCKLTLVLGDIPRPPLIELEEGGVYVGKVGVQVLFQLVPRAGCCHCEVGVLAVVDPVLLLHEHVSARVGGGGGKVCDEFWGCGRARRRREKSDAEALAVGEFASCARAIWCGCRDTHHQPPTRQTHLQTSCPTTRSQTPGPVLSTPPNVPTHTHRGS